MHRVKINKSNYQFFSCWREVGADLLYRLLPHIFATDRDAARATLVPILSDIPPLVLIQLTPGQFAQLAGLTDWCWEEPLTVPIIPQIEHNGQTWKLPAECLYVSPFIEYDHLDNFLQALDGDDPETLNQIIATMLRPVDADGQRIPFNGMNIAKLAIQLADLPEPFKAYCLLFATGCLRHIREEYAVLWKEEETTTARDSRYSLQPEEGTDFSWTGAAFAIAQERVFGTYREVIFTDCHTVLYYLRWRKEMGRLMRK